MQGGGSAPAFEVERRRVLPFHRRRNEAREKSCALFRKSIYYNFFNYTKEKSLTLGFGAQAEGHSHLLQSVPRKASLLNGELGGLDVVDLGVGVVGSALSLADGKLGDVVSLRPLLSSLLLGWLGLDLEVDAVDVRLEASEDLAASDDVALRVLDGEDKLSVSAGLGDAERGREVDLGVPVSWVRADVEAGEVGGTSLSWVADGEELAGVEGVQVDLAQDLDEHVDSDDVAKKGADLSEGLVWEHAAKGAAASDDASVGNNLDEVVDGLGNEGDAGWAEVESSWLVLGDDGLALRGDGDPQGVGQVALAVVQVDGDASNILQLSVDGGNVRDEQAGDDREGEDGVLVHCVLCVFALLARG